MLKKQIDRIYGLDAILRYSAIAILALIFLNIGDLAFRRPFWNLTRLIYLDFESNVSTWVSSALWLVAAYMAYLCSKGSKTKERNDKIWLALSWVFVFFSCDEVAMIHESLGSLLNKHIFKMHHLDSSWGLILGPIALLAAIFFIRSLRGRLKQSRNAKRLLLSGMIMFFVGAIGFEQLVNIPGYEEIRILKEANILFEESFELLSALFIAMGLRFHLVFLSKGKVIA